MKQLKYMTSLIAVAFLCTAQAPGYAQTYNQEERSSSDMSMQPDNTGVNMRDRNANEVTADQQQETVSDRDLISRIRRAVVADKSLSTYAHNVKIISQDGVVTLKGPVRSMQEKDSIVQKALNIAGADRVIDRISVKRVTKRSDQ